MEPGDFVYVEYVGRIKDSGEIFDLTDEEVAKKEKLFNPKLKYGPVPMIVDGEFIIPGLNEALLSMKVGDKKTFEIKPDKAFGDRNAELVKLIPAAKFKEQGVDPTQGAIVSVGDIKGRIVSVDGGRVNVDFNHPLAGRVLEYELKVVKKIESVDDKVKAVVYYFTGLEGEDVKIVVKAKEAEIEVKKKVDMLRHVKERMAYTITKWVKEIELVKFSEIFEKNKLITSNP